MSSINPSHAHHDAHGGAAAAHAHHGDAHANLNPAHYTKIAWILIALAILSYLGPYLGDFLHMRWITLVAAFGIAFYKAYLVIVNFMHLHIEKRIAVYLLSTALAFMLLFYAGASPDVRNHRGRNWENVAAQNETERALAAHAAHAEHGAHGGHEGH